MYPAVVNFIDIPDLVVAMQTNIYILAVITMSARKYIPPSSAGTAILHSFCFSDMTSVSLPVFFFD